MKTTFYFDSIEEPVIIPFTPLSISRKLPYQLCQIGYVHFGKSFFTQREGQKNYQIIYTDAGSGLLTYQGKKYTLGKNQAILINCYEPHYYCTGDEGFWKYRFIHIEGTGCPAFYETINQNGLSPLLLIHSSEFNYCFDKMLRHVEEGNHQSDLAIPALIMRILTELTLHRNNERTRKSEYHQQVIDEAVRFMEQRLGSADFSVTEIARHAGFNENYFSRLFKRMTGASMQEYLIRLRIDRSKHLLKKSAISVSEVAFEVGFDNVNVYIRDFKKLTGVTPLKYRLYAESV